MSFWTKRQLILDSTTGVHFMQVVQALASVKGQSSDFEAKVGRLEGALQLLQADLDSLKVQQ